MSPPALVSRSCAAPDSFSGLYLRQCQQLPAAFVQLAAAAASVHVASPTDTECRAAVIFLGRRRVDLFSLSVAVTSTTCRYSVAL